MPLLQPHLFKQAASFAHWIQFTRTVNYLSLRFAHFNFQTFNLVPWMHYLIEDKVCDEIQFSTKILKYLNFMASWWLCRCDASIEMSVGREKLATEKQCRIYLICIQINYFYLFRATFSFGSVKMFTVISLAACWKKKFFSLSNWVMKMF